MTNDHRALIELARDWHRPQAPQAVPVRWCRGCKNGWPCLTARLADALEQAESRLAPFLDLVWDLFGQGAMSVHRTSAFQDFIKRADAVIAADGQPGLDYVSAQNQAIRDACAAREERDAAQARAEQAASRLEPYLDLVADLNHQHAMSVQKVSRYHEFLERARTIINADRECLPHLSELAKARNEAWEMREERDAALERAASLAEYSQHKESCPRHPFKQRNPSPCNCGLSAALGLAANEGEEARGG